MDDVCLPLWAFIILFCSFQLNSVKLFMKFDARPVKGSQSTFSAPFNFRSTITFRRSEKHFDVLSGCFFIHDELSQFIDALITSLLPINACYSLT